METSWLNRPTFWPIWQLDVRRVINGHYWVSINHAGPSDWGLALLSSICAAQKYLPKSKHDRGGNIKILDRVLSRGVPPFPSVDFLDVYLRSQAWSWPQLWGLSGWHDGHECVRRSFLPFLNLLVVDLYVHRLLVATCVQVTWDMLAIDCYSPWKLLNRPTYISENTTIDC